MSFNLNKPEYIEVVISTSKKPIGFIVFFLNQITSTYWVISKTSGPVKGGKLLRHKSLNFSPLYSLFKSFFATHTS